MGSGLLGFVPGYLQLGRGRGTVLTPPPEKRSPAKKKSQRGGGDWTGCTMLTLSAHRSAPGTWGLRRWSVAAECGCGCGAAGQQPGGPGERWELGSCPHGIVERALARHVCEEGTGLVCQHASGPPPPAALMPKKGMRRHSC